MGNKSNISWTEATWNPHMGCEKVSAGCKYCYLHRLFEKGGSDPNAVFRNKTTFNQPLFWKGSRVIFTCSMSDFFIKDADKWRDEIWEVIKKTPHHTYLILTKRPERIKECLPKDWSSEFYNHVWLGVSVENQETVHRISTLAEIPCELKWVSFEPLIGEVYLSKSELDIIDWAVIGGEAGNETGKYRYRKSELSWFLSLMYQFRDSGIPVFFKQFGTWYHKNGLFLKDSKGENYCKNFPEGFRVRQFPEQLKNNEDER